MGGEGLMRGGGEDGRLGTVLVLGGARVSARSTQVDETVSELPRFASGSRGSLSERSKGGASPCCSHTPSRYKDTFLCRAWRVTKCNEGTGGGKK